MKILLFGGTRYIGKHIAKALLANDHCITLATRGLAPDTLGSQVTRLVVDRTSRESLLQTVPNCVYDVVFDSLAYCSNDVVTLLDCIKTKRYVQISSAAVYPALHSNTKEEEFDAAKKAPADCSRADVPYDEGKRQAECSLAHKYPHIPSVSIRFPFVLGADDYTNRLSFYVEHTLRRRPMWIDNVTAQMAFVRSDEAGKFVASFAENDFTGAINGASPGTISIHELLSYVTLKTGIAPVLTKDGDPAPYNGAQNYTLNTDKAAALDFSFSPLKGWIYELIDFYVATARE